MRLLILCKEGGGGVCRNSGVEAWIVSWRSMGHLRCLLAVTYMRHRACTRDCRLDH